MAERRGPKPPAAAAAVAARLQDVRERLAAACARAGRPEGDVKLVAVSKRIPLPLVVAACRAGQWDLGENRVVDALTRQTELPPLLRRAGLDPEQLRWHFIGHLQRNKAGKAAGRFAMLHGVDSLALAERLSRQAATTGRCETILLEVNISGESQKHGLDSAQLPELLAAVTALPGLDVVGLMGMGRYAAPPTELAGSFADLRRLRDEVSRTTGRRLPELSMGMSGDFEIAVAEGATIVRIGGAIFGPRPT